MAIGIYLWGIAIAAILCWSSAAIIILKTDPRVIDLRIFIFLFTSLFFALTMTITYFSFFIKNKFIGNKVLPKKILSGSFRQAILISLAIIGLLLLQLTRVLNWWDGFLLVTAVLLLELYFRSK